MENLQPLEAYTQTDISWPRIGVVMGLVFAIVMLASATMAGVPLDQAITVCLLAGLAAAVLFPLIFSRLVQKMIRKGYRGDPPFQVTAPGDAYTHRLPASLRVSDKMAVGGVLFVSPASFAFVPHSRNLPKYRATVLIPVVENMQIDTVPQAMTPLRHLILKSLPPLLRINEFLFVSPRPEDTAAKLRDIILRAHGKPRT